MGFTLKHREHRCLEGKQLLPRKYYILPRNQEIHTTQSEWLSRVASTLCCAFGLLKNIPEEMVKYFLCLQGNAREQNLKTSVSVYGESRSPSEIGSALLNSDVRCYECLVK